MLANPALSLEKRSSLGSELFQYMDFINQLHGLQADWKFYDESFRIFKQYNDQAPFSCYDPELKDEAISRAKKLEHFKKSQNNASSQAKPYSIPSQRQPHRRNGPSAAMLSEAKTKLGQYDIPKGYCNLFLAAMPCFEGTCPFKHVCPFCNGKHTAAQCYRPAYAGQNRQQITSSHPATGMYRARGPNNHGPIGRHWRHKTLDVAGPVVLNVPAIKQFLSESAPPEIGSSIVNGLMFGVSLGYAGPDLNVHMANLTSASIKPEVTQKLLDKEISAGRIAGPFPKPPFDTMRINPIGLVPKKNPNEFRLIMDLSQPHGTSVNDFIPQSESAVTYPTIQTAIDVILDLHGQGKFPILSKVDVKSAFRLLPLAPQCFPLTGLFFNGNYYVDKFLPMGASSSCKLYQEFSNAITSIAQHQFGIQHIQSYLDDHLIISNGLASGTHDLNQFLSMAESINLPLATDKIDGPKPTLEFLGIELDCTKLEARLPAEKVAKGKCLINSLLVHKRSTTKRLESLHGFLSFCASIIPAGRAFLRSLVPLMKSKHNWVSLSRQIIADLETWAEFLDCFNGKSMFIHSTIEQTPGLTLGTDSSGSWGCAAVLADEYLTLQWPAALPRNNLSLLEFYPIVLAVHVWWDELRNARLTIKCDNLATVYIINKLKSSDELTMKLVRLFALQCLKGNILFQAVHIPGRLNTGPDLLSRGRVLAFNQLFPSINQSTRVIPKDLLPCNLLLS